MKFKVILLFLACLFLYACHNVPLDNNGAEQYFLAANSGSKSNKTKYIPVPVAGQLMSLKKTSATDRLIGEAAIENANKKSIKQPTSGEYINSIMTFNYMPGALYQIYCAPLSVTDVQFQSGEHVIAVGAGDTMRWQVSKTHSGAGSNRHEHLLIKPIDEGLTTSLVVTTDLRTYHIMLHSTTKTYMASVTWRYPDSDGNLVANLNDDGDYGAASAINSIDVNNMRFVYKVKLVKGSAPDWYPRMVFNDGNKTYIKFSSTIQELPILFVGGMRNNQLINYRTYGDYYIIDSVLHNAQLRGGPNNNTIIQISTKK
jgi:P-type conjugative transfer protein TrbG